MTLCPDCHGYCGYTGENGCRKNDYCVTTKKEWVCLTQTQVKLLREGVHEEYIKTGDSIDWVFYTHINEALKEKKSV